MEAVQPQTKDPPLAISYGLNQYHSAVSAEEHTKDHNNELETHMD